LAAGRSSVPLAAGVVGAATAVGVLVAGLRRRRTPLGSDGVAAAFTLIVRSSVHGVLAPILLLLA
jgi:hypothetical protein